MKFNDIKTKLKTIVKIRIKWLNLIYCNYNAEKYAKTDLEKNIFKDYKKCSLSRGETVVSPLFHHISPPILAHFLVCYASCTLTLRRASFALIISYLPSAACAVLMTSIKTRLSRFTPFLIRSPVSLAMRVPFLFLSGSQRRAGACSRCRL